MAALAVLRRCPARLRPPPPARSGASWALPEPLRAALGRLRARLRADLHASCAHVRQLYGDDAAAAFFALSCGGAARFGGRDGWLRADGGGRWREELLRLHRLPVVAVDLRGSDVGYGGLEHLVRLPQLQHLDLGGCRHLDDWALARLHPLAGSLRELSLAGCPRVTERGLAALHHLRLLQRLDVSGLPAVSHKGLVRILLEEMLPGCRVVGMEHEEDEDGGVPGSEPSPAGTWDKTARERDKTAGH